MAPKPAYQEVRSSPQGGSGEGTTHVSLSESKTASATDQPDKSTQEKPTASGQPSELLPPIITDSGKMAEEVRKVTAFSRIENNSVADVSVEIGQKPKLSLKADANIVPVLKTKVSGETLTVYTTEPFETGKKMVVTVVTPRLTAVELGSTGNVGVAGVSEDQMALNMSGSGSLTVGGITKNLKLQLSGAGSAALNGLMAEHATVEVNGSGSAKIFCTDTLDATINGSGNIEYKGDPEIKSSLRGSGSLKPQ